MTEKIDTNSSKNTLAASKWHLLTAEEKIAANLAYGSRSPLTKIIDGDNIIELPGKMWQFTLEEYERINPWIPELIKYSLLTDMKEHEKFRDENLKDPDDADLFPRFQAMMRLLGAESC